MRNSTIFISAVMITSAVVMIYGVAAAYQGVVNTPIAVTQVSVVSIPKIPISTPSIPIQTMLKPEEAAQTAARVLGRMDLPKAESSSFNGQNAYKITFTSGDVVYIGFDGMILSIKTLPQVIMVQVQPTKRPKNNNTGNNNVSSSNNNGQDSHNDDHEDGG